MKKIITALFVTGALASTTQAGIIINANEVGDDVVISYSGSINTTSLTPGSTFMSTAHGFNGTYHDIGGVYNFEGTTTSEWFANDNLQTSGAIGNYSYQPANSYEGDDFGIDHSFINKILLPTGYISGSEIAGSMTYNTATLASLGINEGENTAVWTFGSGDNADSVTFSAAIPEPATFGLLGLFGGGIFAVRRIFMI